MFWSTKRRLFEQAAGSYLAVRRLDVSASTLRLDRERLVPLLAHFRGRRLQQLSAEELTAYQAKRLNQGVSNRTINMEIGVVRRILRMAGLSFHGRVAHLPENEDAARILSPAERRRLLEVGASNPRWVVVYSAAEISLNTTARRGELRSARWREILFELNCWKVAISKGRTAGKRTLPLNAAARRGFQRLRRRALRIFGEVNPDFYVFPARDERTRRWIPTRHQKNWDKAWRSMTRAAGLSGLRFHDLRHQCVTELLEKGVPDAVVRAVAGHKTAEMLERYTHIRLRVMRSALDCLVDERVTR